MKSKYTITNMLQRVCGKAVLVLMALICTVTACDDPYEGDTFTVYDMQPASTYLSSREDCSEWVAIMKYADLYNAVNQATQYFTVFVRRTMPCSVSIRSRASAPSRNWVRSMPATW